MDSEQKRRFVQFMKRELIDCGVLTGLTVGNQMDYETHYNFHSDFNELALRKSLMSIIESYDKELEGDYKSLLNLMPDHLIESHIKSNDKEATA
jgi:hypothetical protein